MPNEFKFNLNILCDDDKRLCFLIKQGKQKEVQ